MATRRSRKSKSSKKAKPQTLDFFVSREHKEVSIDAEADLNSASKKALKAAGFTEEDGVWFIELSDLGARSNSTVKTITTKLEDAGLSVGNIEDQKAPKAEEKPTKKPAKGKKKASKSDDGDEGKYVTREEFDALKDIVDGLVDELEVDRFGPRRRRRRR